MPQARVLLSPDVPSVCPLWRLPSRTYAIQRERPSRLANCSRFSGTSMMRSPSGSLPGANQQPASWVCVNCLHDSDHRAWLESREVSSSSLDFITGDRVGDICHHPIWVAARDRGLSRTALKSAICCAIYAAERPASLEFSGPPDPSARWQEPHASTAGFLPRATISALLGGRQGANRPKSSSRGSG